MSCEELQDYAKTLFADLKFIDMIVKFCEEDQENMKSPEQNKEGGLENSYTLYVSNEKAAQLYEIVYHLPLITSKDKNVSTGIRLAIHQDK